MPSSTERPAGPASTLTWGPALVVLFLLNRRHDVAHLPANALVAIVWFAELPPRQSAGAPAPSGQRSASVVQYPPMTAEVLLQGIVSGLLMGLVYALIAAGLSLIFGLMEIVNFAHGEFLMVAMFTSYWAWALWRLDPLVSLPATVCLLFVLGVTTYYGLIRWILDAPMLAQIFATFGLAVFLRSAAQALWGVDFLVVKNPLVEGRISVGGLFLGLPQLTASAGALAAFAGLHWFISRTETGLALQATAQDRQAASLMGIDTQRMFALGWGIGAACLGVAGALLATFFYVFPEVGSTFALLAYVAVALGGFGNVPGTLVAGVVVGLVEVLGGLLIAPALKYAVVFAIYLVVVLWRPQGLFGRF